MAEHFTPKTSKMTNGSRNKIFERTVPLTFISSLLFYLKSNLISILISFTENITFSLQPVLWPPENWNSRKLTKKLPTTQRNFKISHNCLFSIVLHFFLYDRVIFKRNTFIVSRFFKLSLWSRNSIFYIKLKSLVSILNVQFQRTTFLYQVQKNNSTFFIIYLVS